MEVKTPSQDILNIAKKLSEKIKKQKITETPIFYFNNVSGVEDHNTFDTEFLQKLRDQKDLNKEYIASYIK